MLRVGKSIGNFTAKDITELFLHTTNRKKGVISAPKNESEAINPPGFYYIATVASLVSVFGIARAIYQNEYTGRLNSCLFVIAAPFKEPQNHICYPGHYHQSNSEYGI